VSPAELKLLMENALSKLPQEEGRFGQIAGFEVTYDAQGAALAFDEAGGRLNDGSRVLSIQLVDGTYIVRDGAVVPGAPDVSVATIDFMARGGDQYPFSGEFTSLGVTYQQALVAYVTEGLGGIITITDYPEGDKGRIVAQ
jgi:5'-nucleotidase